MTLPKGYYKLKQIVTKNLSIEAPILNIFTVFFYIDIALFFLLILIAISEEFKILIFLVYFLSSLLLIFLLIRHHLKTYSIKEFIANTKSIKLYETYRKALYIIPSALIAFIVYYYVTSIMHLPFGPALSPLFSFSINTLILFFIVVYCHITFSYTAPSFLSKEFNFYEAQSYINKTISEDIDEKIKFLTQGLNTYNKYLRKRLKLQLKITTNVCSKIITDPNTDITLNDPLNDLRISFDNDEDKLKPVKAISVLLNNRKADEILTDIPNRLRQRITDYGRAIGPLVGAATAVITVILGL
jgi:hypothetical protein